MILVCQYEFFYYDMGMCWMKETNYETAGAVPDKFQFLMNSF